MTTTSRPDSGSGDGLPVARRAVARPVPPADDGGADDAYARPARRLPLWLVGGASVATLLIVAGLAAMTVLNARKAARERAAEVAAPPPAGKRPAEPAAREWNAAAYQEIDAAYRVNPINAAERYSGSRWKLAVKVESIDIDALFTDRGIVSLRNMNQARAVVNGGRYLMDVEVTISRSHSTIFEPLFSDGVLLGPLK